MTPVMGLAAGGILLAAALYTVAVFAERRAGLLKPWHLVLFWLGFVVDTAATTLMSLIAGGLKADIHGVLGFSAILVMFAHSVWATVVLVQKREAMRRQFHKLSLAVWALWMVTLVTGFGLALPRVIAASRGQG